MKAATILFLAVSSADIALAAGGLSTKTILNVCTTGLGPSAKNPVPTTSRYLTIPLVAKQRITSTPSTTITPAPATETSTTTFTALVTTTLPQVTETVDTTTFVTSTSVVESTEVSTTVDLSTEVATTIVTSTIPAPPGFTPVRSSVPNSLKKRKASHIEKKAAAVEVVRAQPKGELVIGPKRYPTNVYCGGIVAVVSTKTSTSTATTTTTIHAPTPTITTTVSTTITSSITIIPPGATITNIITSNVEVTSTSIISSTTTVKSTTTITAEVPGPTIYDACSADNIVRTVNGVQIQNGLVQPNFVVARTSDRSPYDCCVACINTANCGTSFYYTANGCYLINNSNNQCSQNNNAIRLSAVAGQPTPYDISVSNGNCGINTPPN
jgi:hypothetical protein